MQVSIVRKSQTVGDFRIDAECYMARFIKCEKKLKGMPHTTLGSEAKLFSKGIFNVDASFYADVGIPFVRISDLKGMIIDESSLVKIPEWLNKLYSKTVLVYGDVILSKTAYPAASLVTLDVCNVSQDTIAIKLKNKSKIEEALLVAFLNGKYGKLQMQRWFTGNVQMHLNLKDSRNIIIPILSNKFQNIIRSSFEASLAHLHESKRSYTMASDILLAELRLANWQPKHRLTFVKNYSDVEQAGRIDAEYFQPKYEEIVAAIKGYPGGWDTLGKLVSIKDVNYAPEDERIYKYIELSNIGQNGEITACTNEIGQNLPSRARRKIAAGDVIVSSVEGSLGSIALVTNEFNGALCSTGFHVIRSDALNAETLLIFLQSTLGQMQLKKGCSGTILTAINKEELEKIVIPKVVEDKQREIRQKVAESFHLRKQSKHLLECAIRAVEIAIEQDEQTAIAWLESQTLEKSCKST